MSHAQVIAYLIAAYPRSEFPQPTQKLYVQELRHIDADELMEAARYHVHTSPYPNIPTIGELEAALAVIRKRRAAVPDAFQAWGEVVRELSRSKMTTLYLCQEGAYLRDATADSLPEEYWDDLHAYDDHLRGCKLCREEKDVTRFSHPLIAETMRAVAITEIGGDNEGVQRAHFVKAYEQLAKRQTDEHLLMLGEGE